MLWGVNATMISLRFALHSGAVAAQPLNHECQEENIEGRRADAVVLVIISV